MDTGGGTRGTITKRSCLVLTETGNTETIIGYGDKGDPRKCPISDVVVKVHVHGRDFPVLMILNNVNVLDDPDENESLALPFQFWQHGVRCCLRPPEYGGACGMDFPTK